ncbi:MAG: hypothetical protein ACLUVV_03030 [Christensenellales bacterium]
MKSIAPVPFNRCFIAACRIVTALLSVGGFIVFFFTLSTFCWPSVFCLCWPCYGRSSCSLDTLRSWLPFLRGLFEMTDGCLSLCAPDTPALSLLPLLCALISFGGLCIQSQQALFLSPCGVRFSESLFFKTVHGVLAFVLCSVCVRAFPTAAVTSVAAAPVFSFGQRLLLSTGTLGITALFLALLCCAMSLYTLAFQKRKKKACG